MDIGEVTVPVASPLVSYDTGLHRSHVTRHTRASLGVGGIPSLKDTEVPEYGCHQPGKSQAGQPDIQPDGHPVAGCSLVEERLLSDFIHQCGSEGRLPVERSGTAPQCSAREIGVAST